MTAAALAVLTCVVPGAFHVRADAGMSAGAQGGTDLVAAGAGAAGWIGPELALTTRVDNALLDVEYGPRLFATSGPVVAGVAHAGSLTLDVDAAPGRRVFGELQLFYGPTSLRTPTGRAEDLLLPVTSWHSVDANLGLWQELTRRTRLTVGGAFFSGGALLEAEQALHPRYFGPLAFAELEYDADRNNRVRPRLELGRTLLQEGAENQGRLGMTWVQQSSRRLQLSAGAGAAALWEDGDGGARLLPALAASAEHVVPWRTRRLELSAALELAPKRSLFTGRQQLTAAAEGRARWVVRERLGFTARIAGFAATAEQERATSAALGVDLELNPELHLSASVSGQHRLIPGTAATQPFGCLGWFAVSWRVRDVLGASP